MAERVTHGHFETFARARLEFVRNIASLSERPEYLESLLDEDAFGMLRGLLHDKVPTVQQTAALAVGRMAGFSTELSEELVKSGILEQLTASMRGSTAGHMKAGAFVIRSVAKHSEDLCQCCVEAGCCPDASSRQRAQKERQIRVLERHALEVNPRNAHGSVDNHGRADGELAAERAPRQLREVHAQDVPAWPELERKRAGAAARADSRDLV